jgi:hypothetical protein
MPRQDNGPGDLKKKYYTINGKRVLFVLAGSGNPGVGVHTTEKSARDWADFQRKYNDLYAKVVKCPKCKGKKCYAIWVSWKMKKYLR